MKEQVKEIVNKTQIADLLIRYFAAIDDKNIDLKTVQATFSPDAKIIRPDGSEMIGREEIFNGHVKSFARFKAIHHVLTNFIIDIHENSAVLRSNVIANHLWADNDDNPALNNKYFLAQGVFKAQIEKTDSCWLVKELKNNVIWRTGDGMKEMLNFFKPNK